MREAGADLIHVEAAGQTVHDDRPEYRRGFLTALSDRVRNEAKVPTLVGGYLTTLDEANTIVGGGEPTSCSSTFLSHASKGGWSLNFGDMSYPELEGA